MNAELQWDGTGLIYSRHTLPDVSVFATVEQSVYEAWRRASRSLFKSVDLAQPIWSQVAYESDRLSILLHNSLLSPQADSCRKLLSEDLMNRTSRQIINAETRMNFEAFSRARTELNKCATSPYLEWLCQQQGVKDETIGVTGLLVLKKELVKPTEQVLRSKPVTRRIEIVDGSALSEPIPFGRLYVCGAISLFPESVYSAYRCEEVRWAVFSWMKRDIPCRSAGLYDAERDGPTVKVYCKPEAPPTEVTTDEVALLDGSGLWDASDATVEHFSAEPGGAPGIKVSAIQVLLVGGGCTYVPVNESVTIATAMDSASDESIRIARKLGKDLMADDFLILRTYGEDDVIVSIANRLLGDKAHGLRGMQSKWKEDLLNRVRNSSVEAVVAQLHTAGSVIADYQNVRNWMSPRHIKTQDSKEFFAIMRVTGNDSKSEAAWRMMVTINRAHIRAGMLLKKALRRSLQKHSGAELLAAGRIDVKLSGVDAGELSAIKIESIGRECEVSDSLLFRVVTPWQG